MEVIRNFPDSELVANIRSGQRMEETIKAIYRGHFEGLCWYVMNNSGSRQDAEDIFQEVFIKIIDTLRKGKYNHEGKFLQWAMRISYNMCVDYFRRTKRRPKVSPTETFDIFDVLQAPEGNAEQNIMRSQTHDRVRQLVDMLPPEQREVVILRHYADMSFKEIAKLTRVSINTALGRMRYALINIRKMVEEREVILQ